MVALHSEFIAGCLFLLSALMLRPDSLFEAGILAAGVSIGPVLYTKPAYSGAWLACLLPLIEHRLTAPGSDWLPLAAGCLWAAGLLALAAFEERRWTRLACAGCWLMALAAAAAPPAVNPAVAWAEAARLAQCSGFALYLHRHMSGSLSPVELVLLSQLLRHLIPAYPLACFCLSTGLVAMDAICRHCLATSAQPVRFTYRGLTVTSLLTCSFGYYALSARLFRPATVARRVFDLANAAALDWRLVSAWLALFSAALLLAGLSGRLPLRQMTQRKLFHFLASGPFAVALLLGGAQRLELLSAAAYALLLALLAVDTLRRHDVAGIGRRLRGLLAPLFGPRDSSELLLTPLALLLGLAAPLWLRLASGAGAGLSVWSGILSVGIGDSLAGLVGSRFGRIRWPQLSRTLEGSAACFVGQLTGIRCLLGVSGLDPASWPAYLLPALSVTLVEAFLAQVDNLALPVCLYFLLAD